MRVGIGRSSPADREDLNPVALAICEALAGAAGLASEPPGRGDGPDHPEAETAAPDAETARPGAEAGGPDAGRLRRTVREVEGRNYQVVNVDVTLRAAGPPAPDRLREMREALADRMHVSPGHVSVTVGEPGGTPGAEEDPTAVAVALVDRIGSVDPIHAALRAGG